jgi:hypothetical protein
MSTVSLACEGLINLNVIPKQDNDSLKHSAIKDRFKKKKEEKKSLPNCGYLDVGAKLPHPTLHI